MTDTKHPAKPVPDHRGPTMNQPQTTWRPLPTCMADQHAIPFGITIPNNYTPEKPELDKKQELALTTIQGKPMELKMKEGHAEFTGHYRQQFDMLRPTCNSFVPERHLSRKELGRVHGTLSSYLRHYNGWYQAGWRARTVQSHPDDGKQRIWIAPVAGNEE